MKNPGSFILWFILIIAVRPLSAAFISWDGDVRISHATGNKKATDMPPANKLTSDTVQFNISGTSFQPGLVPDHSILGVNFTDAGWTFGRTAAQTMIQGGNNAGDRFDKGLAKWNELPVKGGIANRVPCQTMTGIGLTAQNTIGGILNPGSNHFKVEGNPIFSGENLRLDIVSAAIFSKTEFNSAGGNIIMGTDVKRP